MMAGLRAINAKTAHQTAINSREVKKERLLALLGKLNDRDTQQRSAEALSDLLQDAEWFDADIVPFVISTLCNPAPDQKVSARKMVARSISLLAGPHCPVRQHVLTAPHLTKLINLLKRTLQDADSIVREAGSEAAAAVAQGLAELDEDGSLLSQPCTAHPIGKMLLECLADGKEKLQASACIALGLAAPFLGTLESPVAKDLLKRLVSPSFQAVPSLVSALGKLDAATGNPAGLIAVAPGSWLPLLPSLVGHLPATTTTSTTGAGPGSGGGGGSGNLLSQQGTGLCACLASKDWHERKAASDCVRCMVLVFGPHLEEAPSQFGDGRTLADRFARALEQSKFDKVKEVREVARDAVLLVEALQTTCRQQGDAAGVVWADLSQQLMAERCHGLQGGSESTCTSPRPKSPPQPTKSAVSSPSVPTANTARLSAVIPTAGGGSDVPLDQDAAAGLRSPGKERESVFRANSSLADRFRRAATAKDRIMDLGARVASASGTGSLSRQASGAAAPLSSSRRGSQDGMAVTASYGVGSTSLNIRRRSGSGSGSGSGVGPYHATGTNGTSGLEATLRDRQHGGDPAAAGAVGPGPLSDPGPVLGAAVVAAAAPGPASHGELVLLRPSSSVAPPRPSGSGSLRSSRPPSGGMQTITVSTTEWQGLQRQLREGDARAAELQEQMATLKAQHARAQAEMQERIQQLEAKLAEASAALVASQQKLFLQHQQQLQQAAQRAKSPSRGAAVASDVISSRPGSPALGYDNAQLCNGGRPGSPGSVTASVTGPGHYVVRTTVHTPDGGQHYVTTSQHIPPSPGSPMSVSPAGRDVQAPVIPAGSPMSVSPQRGSPARALFSAPSLAAGTSYDSNGLPPVISYAPQVDSQDASPLKRQAWPLTDAVLNSPGRAVSAGPAPFAGRPLVLPPDAGVGALHGILSSPPESPAAQSSPVAPANQALLDIESAYQEVLTLLAQSSPQAPGAFQRLLNSTSVAWSALTPRTGLQLLSTFCNMLQDPFTLPRVLPWMWRLADDSQSPAWLRPDARSPAGLTVSQQEAVLCSIQEAAGAWAASNHPEMSSKLQMLHETLASHWSSSGSALPSRPSSAVLRTAWSTAQQRSRNASPARPASPPHMNQHIQGSFPSPSRPLSPLRNDSRNVNVPGVVQNAGNDQQPQRQPIIDYRQLLYGQESVSHDHEHEQGLQHQRMKSELQQLLPPPVVGPTPTSTAHAAPLVPSDATCGAGLRLSPSVLSPTAAITTTAAGGDGRGHVRSMTPKQVRAAAESEMMGREAHQNRTQQQTDQEALRAAVRPTGVTQGNQHTLDNMSVSFDTIDTPQNQATPHLDVSTPHNNSNSPGEPAPSLTATSSKAALSATLSAGVALPQGDDQDAVDVPENEDHHTAELPAFSGGAQLAAGQQAQQTVAPDLLPTDVGLPQAPSSIPTSLLPGAEQQGNIQQSTLTDTTPDQEHDAKVHSHHSSMDQVDLAPQQQQQQQLAATTDTPPAMKVTAQSSPVPIPGRVDGNAATGSAGTSRDRSPASRVRRSKSPSPATGTSPTTQELQTNFDALEEEFRKSPAFLRAKWLERAVSGRANNIAPGIAMSTSPPAGNSESEVAAENLPDGVIVDITGSVVGALPPSQLLKRDSMPSAAQVEPVDGGDAGRNDQGVPETQQLLLTQQPSAQHPEPVAVAGEVESPMALEAQGNALRKNVVPADMQQAAADHDPQVTMQTAS